MSKWPFAVLGLIALWFVVGPFVVPGGAVPVAVLIGLFWLIVIASVVTLIVRSMGLDADYKSLKIRRLLESGQCPACLYKVWTVNPEADSCTVCPECGAAWRVEAADA
ncbi:MAG: hypothetical protein AAF138_02035 [Planctomycetota bacterium]